MRTKLFTVIFFITVAIFAQKEIDTVAVKYELYYKNLLRQLDQVELNLYRGEKQREAILTEIQKVSAVIEERKRKEQKK